jgi:hypothetical protein
MYNFKNLTSSELSLGSLGVILQPNEVRDFISIGDRIAISSSAELLTDMIYTGALIVSDDGVDCSKAESVMIILNSHNTVKVTEITTNSNTRYLYVKDSLSLAKGVAVAKNFKGNVSSIQIRPTLKDLSVHIESEGVVFHTENIGKLSSYVLETDYKLKNPIIHIVSPSGSNVVEIFIDGDTTMSSTEMQTFIDNF